MMNKSLRDRGRESSRNAFYGFRQVADGGQKPCPKKEPPLPAALKLITGRRQTEWTGATRCPNEDDPSHKRESLMRRKRTILLRQNLPCRPLAEMAVSLEARFLVIAACSRSISEFISAMRSASSSTDNSDRSCPISWVTFFLGLSSSSMAMRPAPGSTVASQPAAG